MTDNVNTLTDELTLPDNLISHRSSWLRAMDRLVELEPESHEPDMDEKGYWRHERQAMLDMFADLDRLQSHRASIPGGVKVKSLIWRPIGPGASDVEAETPFGVYAMSFDAPTAGGAVNLWIAGADNDTFSAHERREHAEAAAQADYERRILATLDLSPAEGEAAVAWKPVMQALVNAVGAMRVPQTVEDVALQLHVTLGPAYTAAKDFLASATPSNPVISDEMVERLARDIAADEYNVGGDAKGVRDSVLNGVWRDYKRRARRYLTAALSVKPQT